MWQSTDSLVNVCAELDWKRCVAVHLWFMLPPTASVADALARYEAAFQVSRRDFLLTSFVTVERSGYIYARKASFQCVQQRAECAVR